MRKLLAYLSVLLLASNQAIAQNLPSITWGPGGGKATIAADLSNITLPAARDNLNNGTIFRRTLADFGAKCDVQYILGNYSIAAGSTTLTLTSGVFPTPYIGNTYVTRMPGHGTGGTTLNTTFHPTDTTHATLGISSVPGTIAQFALSILPISGGSGWAPGDTVTMAGGTLASVGGTATVGTVASTRVRAVSVASAGAGGTNGTFKVYGTTGNGNRAVFNLTVAGGAASAISVATDPSGSALGGHYTTNPTAPTAEPVAISQKQNDGVTAVTLPVGLTLNLTMDIDIIKPTTPGLYANGGMPANPVSQGSTSGSGTGATFTITGAFNSGGLVYGTDDHDAIQMAVNPTTWTTPPPTTAHILIEALPKPCGLGSTVTRSASQVRFEGQGTRSIMGTQPISIIGPALQWLGTDNGTMWKDWPTGATSSSYNLIQHLTFECGIPMIGGQQFSAPGAGIGIDSESQVSPDYGDLSFDGCGTHDIFTSATASGTSDEIYPHIHDISLWHPLNDGADGIYLTGIASSGHDTDYAVVERIDGSYTSAPLVHFVNLDNNKLFDVHFFKRGSQVGVYGVDIGCTIYGSVEANQANTAYFQNISSLSIMRGKESCATPPANVVIEGHDPTNSVPATVIQPGAGFVEDRDWNGKRNMWLVSTLPTCGSLSDGVSLIVLDQAAAPVYATAPTGGGALRAKVTCTNGTGWLLQ